VHERQRSPYRSPSRSPWRSNKCPNERKLHTAGQGVWPRKSTVFGLERPHFCTRFRGQSDSWVAPAHTFAENREAGQRGIGVLLTIQKSYELLANYGCFAREICDKCGIVLGAVRFTRHGESEVYCSRECRGDAHGPATLRPGRPRKYKTDRDRRAAKTRQQRTYRSHPKVEKTARIQSKTKNLQTQKVPLSYLDTPAPGEPLISSQQE
jgi:hypothetical protein